MIKWLTNMIKGEVIGEWRKELLIANRELRNTQELHQKMLEYVLGQSITVRERELENFPNYEFKPSAYKDYRMLDWEQTIKWKYAPSVLFPQMQKSEEVKTSTEGTVKTAQKKAAKNKSKPKKVQQKKEITNE